MEYLAPVEVIEVRERAFIPCNASEIQVFLKAQSHGMKDVHFATREQIRDYIIEHGIV